MTTVLSPSGVELPDPGDPHSRAQLNRDFTKINDLWTAYVAFAKMDRQLLFQNTGYAWTGGSSWDAGTLSVDTTASASSQMSSPQPSFAVAGSLSGAIKITVAGLYVAQWVISPGAVPGNSGYQIVMSGTWPGPPAAPDNILGQTEKPTGSQYASAVVQTQLFRVPSVNLEIRCIGIQANSTTNVSKVRLIQLGAF